MKLSHGLRIAALIVTLVLAGAVSLWATGTTETAEGGPVTLNRLIIGEAGADYIDVPFEDNIVAQEILERFNVRLENEVILFADAGEYNRLNCFMRRWARYRHRSRTLPGRRGSCEIWRTTSPRTPIRGT